MTDETIGSVKIELRLDRERFDRDTDLLQKETIQPFAVGLKLGASGLQKQLKTVKLDCLPVKLCPDFKELERKLKKIKDYKIDCLPVQLCLHTGKFEKQLKQFQGRIKDQELTIRVNADTTAFQQQISRMRSRIGTVDVAVNLKYQKSSQLPGTLTQKVELDTKDLESKLSSSIERAFKRVQGGGLLGNLGGVIAG